MHTSMYVMSRRRAGLLRRLAVRTDCAAGQVFGAASRRISWARVEANLASPAATAGDNPAPKPNSAPPMPTKTPRGIEPRSSAAMASTWSGGNECDEAGAADESARPAATRSRGRVTTTPAATPTAASATITATLSGTSRSASTDSCPTSTISASDRASSGSHSATRRAAESSPRSRSPQSSNRTAGRPDGPLIPAVYRAALDDSPLLRKAAYSLALDAAEGVEFRYLPKAGWRPSRRVGYQ